MSRVKTSRTKDRGSRAIGTKTIIVEGKEYTVTVFAPVVPVEADSCPCRPLRAYKMDHKVRVPDLSGYDGSVGHDERSGQ